MSDRELLKREFKDEEYKYAYLEEHLYSRIAIQLAKARRQQGLTQEELAVRVGTKQSGIARVEDVNYRGWKVETLAAYARALGLHLIIKFGTEEEALDDLQEFDIALKMKTRTRLGRVRISESHAHTLNGRER